MSTAEKVARVREVREEFGLAPALSVLDLPRSTWYYHRDGRRSYAEKYAHLRGPLEAIARRSPEYGYRRSRVELGASYGHDVNHKVVQRLHRLWDLPLLRGTRKPKPSGIRRAIEQAGERANLLAQLEAIGPFEVAYTDFTELVYAGGRRKAHLIAIVDHETKVALGWALGERAIIPVALEAWARARERLSELGIDWTGLILHQDQDPVFTSYAWTARLLLDDGVRLSYTLRGAQDNPEMEAFFSRFKTENRSLFLEAADLDELRALVRERMDYYNRERRHSALGYLAPLRYVEVLEPGV